MPPAGQIRVSVRVSGFSYPIQSLDFVNFAMRSIINELIKSILTIESLELKRIEHYYKKMSTRSF